MAYFDERTPQYDGSTYPVDAADLMWISDVSPAFDRPCPVSVFQAYLEAGLSLDAARITGGTLDIARIPTGTSSSTVSLGNHTHAAYAPLASPTFTGTTTFPGSSQITSGGALALLTSPISNFALTAGAGAWGSIYCTGDIWCLGSNVRQLFGQNSSVYSSFNWDTTSSSFGITGNGNLGFAGCSIVLPYVSSKVSLVGIAESSPQAQLHVSCNGTNTTRVERIQTTQSSGSHVIEDVIQLKLTTTDATVTYATLQTSVSNNTYYLETDVIARRTAGGSTGDSNAYKLLGLFKDVSGTVTQIGSTTKTVVGESDSGCDADYNISGTAIRVAVTGIGSVSYTWHATSRIRFLSS